MREASCNRRRRNNAQCTNTLTRLFEVSCLNDGTHLHCINNGVPVIVICLRYLASPLIF